MADISSLLDWIDTRQADARRHLLALAEINSGSFNAAGVDAVGQQLAALFSELGPHTERLDVSPFASTADDGSRPQRPLGRALRMRKRPDAPLQVFLGGHLDTVFPLDSAFQTVREIDADTLNGPGVADLKGGMLVMWLALSALERSPWASRVGWEVLFNPDEEIGSQGSAPLLAEAARRHHFGLIYEPALPDGSLAGARKGSGNFDVVVRGRAAHAGRNPELGRNAVRAAADFIRELDERNGRRPGLTINPGYVHGGGALNVVPDHCVVKFNVRTTSFEDQAWLESELDGLLAMLRQRDGISVERHGGFTRPPKPFDESNQRLAQMLQDCGDTLGTPLRFTPTGGCCDGNNLKAHGLANVDNLGVIGGEIHSDREWMRVSSITERARLSAMLLLRLASGEWQWHG